MDTNDATNIGHLFASEPAPNAPAPADPVMSEPAPQPADAYVAPVAAPPAPPAAPPEPQQPATHLVPLAELIGERRERQELAKQNRELLEAMQRLRRPQQPAPEPIDPVTDPERAFLALEQRMEHRLLNQHLNNSERFARTQHGNEIVDQALEAAQQAGYAQTFVNRADPYGELVSWYQGQRLSQEIGTDPAAYRARIEAEVKAKLLAELRAGAGTPPNLPPSLSSATKANGTPEVVVSEKDFFNSMMSNRRTQ